MVAVMATIFILSHTPGEDIPLPVDGLDKIYHAIAYATLALTCLYAISPLQRNIHFFKTGCAVIFFCLLYGITDEFHQSFVAGRYSDWHDLVADTTGSFLAVVGWWRVRSYRADH